LYHKKPVKSTKARCLVFKMQNAECKMQNYRALRAAIIMLLGTIKQKKSFAITKGESFNPPFNRNI
jgi:hypothetical protein